MVSNSVIFCAYASITAKQSLWIDIAHQSTARWMTNHYPNYQKEGVKLNELRLTLMEYKGERRLHTLDL